ncbi:MAG: rRNA maturation RNase YbeY [Candidatus Omnitrophica bacterium]|nr:rRNA maturation RNase YbeY [Candidatus Omnitrophota bacterium]
MIQLNTFNISRCRVLSKRKLKKAVTSILRSFAIDNTELSIVFATDKEIKVLNKAYRMRGVPTDVLSFSMREGKRVANDSGMLGDIVISVDRAKAQAKIFGTSFRREMELYIIHGVLHLLGYDDEEPAAEKKMRKKERELLDIVF